jgi:hypothetical protein
MYDGERSEKRSKRRERMKSTIAALKEKEKRKKAKTKTPTFNAPAWLFSTTF